MQFGIVGLILALAFACAEPAHAYSDEYAMPKTWLEGYRPNYFLFGNPDSKIQLSAKTQVFEDKRLYFAYSQTMFWDIGDVSSPIANVDFNPELFYRLDFGPSRRRSETAPDDSAVSPKSWFDIGLLEHESNGQSGAASRSWNRSYVRYELESRYESDLRVYTSFKAWIPYKGSFDAGNADLLAFRGLYELNFTVAGFLGGEFPRNDLTLRLYSGGPSHLNPFGGGQELTFRFSHTSGPQFVPLWTLQIFNGYGESLLDYRSRRTIFRAGLSF